jgi:uncharacterized protein (DUF58 family)
MNGMKPRRGEGAPQSVATQPSGYLLYKKSLLVFWAILLLAAWKSQAGIVILIGVVFSAAGLAALWSRVSLVGVRCRRSVGESRLFPGECTEMTLKVINRKLLPLPWIRIENEIPAEISGGLPALPGSRPGLCLLSRSGSIPGYSQLSWKFRLEGGKRGFYRLGPVGVASGDIFGFYPRWASIPLSDAVIVYPRIFPLDRLDVPSLHPMGETRTGRRIFQDPTRTIGIQDYRPQDSPKHIHWKASARRQQLQVKVFEPTTTLKVSLFLDASGFQPNDPAAAEDFELAVSAAASIAYQLTEQGTPVGLVSNARLADSGLSVRIPAGGSRDQLIEILEALAKVTLDSAVSSEFLLEEAGSLPSGTSLIVIAGRPAAPLLWMLSEIQERGTRLLLLAVGNGEDAGPACSIPTCRIHDPGGLAEISSRVLP